VFLQGGFQPAILLLLMPSAFLTLRSFLLSLVLHGLAGALLVMSFDFTPKIEQPPALEINIVEAVTVDATQVEAEVERLREEDRRRQQEREKLEKQVADMQKKAKAAEKQRKAEEQKLADLQKKKEQEQKAREEEEQKLAEAKKEKEELERQRKLEEEKAKKAVEEKKRKEAETALKKQMAEEQARIAAEELKQNQRLLLEYSRRIQVAVQQNFNLTGVPSGLSCRLRIRTVPGGEVVSVQVETSSGDEVFDRRAEEAVVKASPLPVPEDAKLYESQFRNFILNYSPGN
jgi:colicin import membrane protein